MEMQLSVMILRIQEGLDFADFLDGNDASGLGTCSHCRYQWFGQIIPKISARETMIAVLYSNVFRIFSDKRPIMSIESVDPKEPSVRPEKNALPTILEPNGGLGVESVNQLISTKKNERNLKIKFESIKCMS